MAKRIIPHPDSHTEVRRAFQRLDSAVDGNETDIAANTTAIAANTADIAANVIDIAANAANIAAIRQVPTGGVSGQVLTTDGSGYDWADIDGLPDQAGHAGEFLTTDATNPSWAAIRQVTAGGTNGYVLTTDGTNYSWQATAEGPQTDTLDSVCDRGSTTDQSLTINGLQVNGYNDDSANCMLWYKTDVDNNFLSLGDAVYVGRIGGRFVVSTKAGTGLDLDLIGQGNGGSVRVNYDTGFTSDPFRVAVGGTSYIDISPGLIVSSTGDISFNDENLQTTGAIRNLADGSKHYFGASNDYSIEWSGTNAVHTITAGAFNFNGGAIRMPTFTTTERDALSPENGMMIYNTTTAQFERYENGAWIGTVSGGGPDEYQVLTWVGNEWTWINSARIVTEPETIYVSTTGNDTTGDGSSGLPYATVDKALEVISEWLLQAVVTIDIAAGTYSTASTLAIEHAQGGLLNISGAYETDSAILTSTNNAGTYVDYTFTATDGTKYTAGDYVLIHTATGGTNPTYMYGTLYIQSVVGSTVTLRHPVVTATAATGSVTASVVIPKVKWARPVYIYSSLRTLQGILNIYNWSSNGLFLYIIPNSPSVVAVKYSIFHNSNASRYGLVHMSKNVGVNLTYFGMSHIGYAMCSAARCTLTWAGATDCTYGLRGYGFAVNKLSRAHFLGCTSIALYNLYMSMTLQDAGPTIMLNNGTDASPAQATEGNFNSWMSY